ncbi:hypothetical protein [Vreelandella piezotolerans]|uniref:hypothetical protein n=1 Tax=Vreelandella piezotolerans TaxID=2609667 RepID=UPI001C62C616|nr:hypothetical protein [Halomonas piezotolerans]
MSEVDILLSGFNGLYRKYMDNKFERLISRAEQRGLRKSELLNSDERFALFMRVGRALEICSQEEMIDYIVDVLIGGIKKGDAESETFIVEMAISTIGELSIEEVKVFLLLREKGMYVSDSEMDETDYEDLVRHVLEKCNIKPEFFKIYCARLSGKGLVSSPGQGYRGSIASHVPRITVLGKRVVDYIYEARGLS